jgi:hypothetical protein
MHIHGLSIQAHMALCICAHISVDQCAHGHMSCACGYVSTWSSIKVEVACIHVQNLVMSYVHKVRVFTCLWLCIHVHMAVLSTPCGHVSMCLFIHVHVAVYSHAEFVSLRVIAQHFIKCYGAQHKLYYVL